MNYDHTLVARHVGISEAALRHLEDGQFNNISVTTVRRLAKTLRVSMSMLLEGVAPHPEDVEKHIGESLDNLRKFAHDKNLPYREFEALHSGFQDQYKRGRVAVVEARSDAVSVREWNERHEALKAGRPYAVPAQRTLALDED